MPEMMTGQTVETHAGVRCPLCGEVGAPIGVREGVPLRGCECGVVSAWAWPDEATYEGWYAHPSAYHEHEQRANGQEPCAQRDTDALRAASLRLDVLLPLLAGAPHGLLDIGAGTGAMVAAWCARGHGAALGLEPNAALVRGAVRLGRPVQQGGWPDAWGRWGLVTLLDVFEHLTRPLECLEALAAHLAPGGFLAIETPEWDGAHQRRHGLGWRHIRPRQHICLWSERALRMALERTGYRAVHVLRPLCGTLGKVMLVAERDEE